MNPQTSNDVPSRKIQDLKETIRNNEKRLTDFQQRIADLQALIDGAEHRNQKAAPDSFSNTRGTTGMDRREQP